jgi:predicted histidine transporter YuiF (NhaC family)
VFASLFERAEASVDNAIGDLGNRVLITIPFIVAFGFAAASLTIYVNRTYGPEIGNLIVAAAFVVLGGIIALVVNLRKSRAPENLEPEAAASEEQINSAKSIFDNEQLMGIVSSAAPILLPALLRTATKNWPLILAVAAGLYVFSFSEDGDVNQQQPQPPQA